jgi:hypothetical protein
VAARAGAPSLVALLGDLHSTALLASFALFGLALLALAAAAADGTLARWLRWSSLLVGGCGVLAGGALANRDFDLGHGVTPVFVALYFFGLPLWLLGAAVSLLRSRPQALPQGELAVEQA